MSSKRLAHAAARVSRVTDLAGPRSPAARERLAGWLEGVALVHVLLPLLIVGGALLGFVVGLPLARRIGVIAAAATAAIVLAPQATRRQAGWWLLAAACTHVAAGVVAALLPDSSWDGLALHQEAVLRLADGWNPLWESAARYGTNEALWLDHYPKASWITAATVLQICGRIEAGKLFNLTLMAAAGAMALATTLRVTRVPVGYAAVGALLIAVNPVAIYQAATFYVDTLVASALTMVVAGLLGYALAGRRRPFAVALLAACLAINVKLTGLAYVAVFFALTAIRLWQQRGRLAAKPTLALLAAGVAGTLVIGWSPYGFNLRDHHDPFYPATPGYNLLSTARQVPGNLAERDRVTRFVVSAFAQTAAVRPPAATRAKLPLWIGGDEWHGLYSADLEAGGFGPLYGALLLAGLAAVIWLAASARTRPMARAVCLVTAGLLISMFVHQETWWARYVPQAWLLPLVAAIPLLDAPAPPARRALGLAIFAAALLNLAIVLANVAWREGRYVVQTRAALAEARLAQPVAVFPGPFRALRQRLREADIRFHFVDAGAGEDVERREIPAPGRLVSWTPVATGSRP